jgi:hypothetical protein
VRTEELRKEWKILAGTPRRKSPLEMNMRSGEYIKIDLQGRQSENVEWIQLAYNVVWWQVLV